MKTLNHVVVCSSLLLSSNVLHGEDTWKYSEDTKTLTVYIPAGVTNVLDDSLDPGGVYRGYLTSNTAKTFKKTGPGGYWVNQDLSAYTGDVMIEGGTYTYTHPKALGNIWANQGDVRVLRGGTLNAHRLASATQNDWAADNSVWFKSIYFEGNGAAGAGGALVYTSEAGAPLTRMHFSTQLIMTGDATIYNAASDGLRLYGTSYYHSNMDMGGHTLTLSGATAGWGWACCAVSNPGNIVVRKCRLLLESEGSQLNGTAENVLSFADGGTLTLNSFGGPCGWTIDGRNLSSLYIVGGAAATSEPNLSSNLWGGNILTGASKLPVFYDSSKCNFTVGGVVSGAGLNVWTQWRGGYNFNLTGAANTFTNGLTVRGESSAADKLGNLYVYKNGALPSAGGPLALTNATVTFKTFETCDLPALVADNVTAVNDGYGMWNGPVTKTGAGDLTWNSLLGGEVLDIRRGNVIVKDRSADRAQLAGFVEGDLLFASGTASAQKNYGTAKTNHVALSMSACYDKDHSFWTVPFPEEITSNPRRTYNYWGYIWNNEATNVTISLAAYLGTHTHLNVGAFTQGSDATSNQQGAHFFNSEPKFATIELEPGATPIQLSGYHSDVNGMRSAYNKNGITWQANFGAGYKFGPATSNSADYVKLEDSGDGSRFTWALPEQIVENVTTIPGTETVIRRAPYFESMKFAAGTGVTFERGWYSVPVLEGLPTVTGIMKALTVTSAFRFNAIDAVTGHKLTTAGTFALGENATIVIEDPAEAARHRRAGVKSFVLVEAEEGVVMPETVTVTGDTEWWNVERSADGKKLMLVYKPKGVVLIVR